MAIRKFFGLGALVALASIILTARAADTYVYGTFYWVGSSPYASAVGVNNFIKLSSPVASPGNPVKATAMPTNGLKSVAWYKHLGGSVAVTTDFELLQNSGAPLTVENDSSVRIDLALKLDWISYKLWYNGVGNTGGAVPGETTYIYTNKLTIASALTRTGYDFVSWTNVANGAAYAAGATGLTGGSFGDLNDVHVDGRVVTLAAQWRAKNYTVTFNANGGGTPSQASKSVTYDSTYGDLPNCSRTGHTFDGWYTAASGGTKITSTTKVAITGNQALYAHWTAVSYTVTVDANGGSGGSCPSYVFSTAQQTKTITLPTRIGYTLTSWTASGATGGTPSVSGTTLTIPANVYGNLTLKANWTANTYTVTVDPNGGSGGSSPSYVFSTEQQTKTITLPTKTGYSVSSWTVNGATNGTPTVSGTTLTIPANVYGSLTLKANWKANGYTVTFDRNGGETPSPATTSVTYDSTYGTLATCSRTGYTFAGWYTAASGGAKIESTTKVAITAAQTLYAHWTAQTYTVTYEANGGGTPSPATTSATYDSTYGTLPSCSRTGYTFDGWYTSASGGTKIESTTKVTITAAQTLHAHWTAKTYTVHFNANGGTASEGTRTVTFDQAYGPLPSASFTGRTLTGWFTATSGGTQVYDSSVVKTAEEHTLYAQWHLNTYTVSFDGNGATSGSMQTEGFNYNEQKNLLPNGFVRTGYQFGGWNTRRDGKGTAYADRESVLQLTSEDRATVTLYAQWSPIAYDIVFLPNGAEVGTMDAQHFLYDEAVALSRNRFVNGELRFLGWSCSNGKTYADGEVVSNLTDRAGVVITNSAMWAGTYHVAFDANCGSGTMAEMTFDDAAEERNLTSNAFVRTGYAFKGWGKSLDDARDGKNLLADGAKVKGLGGPGTTVTLYASWEAIAYYVAYSAGMGVEKKAVDVRSCHYDEAFPLPPVVTNGCYESFDPARYAFGGWTDGITGAKYADEQMVSNLCTVAGATNTLTAVWKLDVGEWSEHMHCTTLRWGIQNAGEANVPWELNDGPTYGCTNTGMSVSEKGGAPITMQQYLAATVQTNGWLSFSCKWHKESDQSMAYLLVAVNTMSPNAPIVVLSDVEWTNVVMRIELPREKSEATILMAVFANDADSIEIDQMVWQPDGGEPDDPPLPAGWYGVKFLAGGGTGKMDEQYCATGTVHRLPACTFTPPEGKTFKGWVGSNQRRYDDEILVFDLADSGKWVKLTAVWE